MKNGKHVILCVDDDPDILESLKVVLEAAGYTFVSAPTAAEGLKVFQRARPDLILADLMMEEVDSGTGFVKELKRLGSQVPVYLLSAVGDELSGQVDTGALGLAGVFQKPIQAKILLGALGAKLKK
ncbi:MAG TPA: response regulator [Myxococcota bacterium]|nr:response regulator [Myxococcota bacterium]HRY95694.1 response regulator [Myxococcota bacterium]HSA20190.1 response regulator [Myxococcota bacterium]